MQSGMPNGMNQQMQSGMPNGMNQQMQNGMNQQMPNGMNQQMQSGMPNGMNQQMPNGMNQQMPNGMNQQMQNGMLQDRRENLNQKRIVYGTDFFEDEKTVCLSSSDKLNQKVAYEKTVFPNEPVQKENMVSMNFPSQMPENETVALNKNDLGQFEGIVALGVNDLELNEGTMDSLNVSEEDVTMDLSSTF